jgi:hypothetical protein
MLFLFIFSCVLSPLHLNSAHRQCGDSQSAHDTSRSNSRKNAKIVRKYVQSVVESPDGKHTTTTCA